jgi:hypothetical protein
MASKADVISRNGRPSGSSPPDAEESGFAERVAHSAARRRACLFCDEYSAHMPHRGLVYQILYDANGGYHRHVAYCPDLGLRERSRLVH